MNKSFDVFLSHNSKDMPAVRALAEALQDRGLNVWLDEWELVPGRPWQEALEEVIETTGAAAVLVGKDGLGPWQDKEMRGCLSEFVDRNLPVIPVLLPGAPEKPVLPIFLKGFTWVDLREGLSQEGLDRLQWGVTGRKPDRAKRPSFPTAEFETLAAGERPEQKVRALWGVPAWIGLLTLLGISIFLSARYLSKPDEPTVRNPAPTPVPAAVQTRPPVKAPGKCVPGKEETDENGITFVRICPGTFTMGSVENDPRADSGEKPAHKVTLSEFWIGKTEITNEQYRRFRRDHPGEAELPATGVTWDEAKAACEHFGGRLPTEAEWEYAARAGSSTTWSFGDAEKLLGEYAWFSGNSNKTPHAVGTRKANAWGIQDMHGNVLEWVADWYGTYPAAAQSNPTGPTTGYFRVLRGGRSTACPPGTCAPRSGTGSCPGTGTGSSAFAVCEVPAASLDFAF